MKTICQKVKFAICKTNNEIVSVIGYGIIIYLGLSIDDTKIAIDYLTKKILNIKIYDSWTQTLTDKNQDVLLIYEKSLSDENIEKNKAEELFNSFYEKLSDDYKFGVVKKCPFDVPFDINICNQGPFTIILEKSSS